MDNSVPSSRDRWLTLGGVAIASFLGCIDFTVVNTAIPAIQADLDASVSTVQWVITLFVVALSTCMVAAGRLADRHGRRRALYVGMALFGVASLGAGLAPGIGWLIGWRFAQGVACAVLYTASTAIVSHAFPEHERGKAIGMLFSANGLGLALGPVLGGLLVAGFGWRWVFLLNVPFVLLSVALCAGRVRESRDETDHAAFDWRGLALFLLALPCLLLAIVYGGHWGWLSVRTGALVATGVAGLLALWWSSRRVASPLIRFDLFARPRFIAASAATSGLAFFYCAAFFLMPLYLGELRHRDSASMGWLLLSTTAVMSLVSPWAGRMADRVGTSPLLLGGFACLAASAAMQACFSASTDWWFVLSAFAFMGLGWGAILGPSTVAALGSVPAQLSGVAMGASWTLHNVGGALGLALATQVFQMHAGDGLLAGYRAAMLLLLGVCAVVWLALVMLRGRH